MGMGAGTRKWEKREKNKMFQFCIELKPDNIPAEQAGV
jgi:hypothetical protein